MAVFGLVGRRLTRSLTSPVAFARATLRPHPVQPRFPPPRLPQVFSGRACSSNGVPPQSSNGVTPQLSNGVTPQSNGLTPQLPKAVTVPPTPAPILPKGYSEDLAKLSDGIADLESDFKLLFHMIWVLYGLIFAVLLKIPGTVGDLGGKTLDLGAGLDVAMGQAKCIKTDLSSLEDEVVKRNAKKVSRQATPTAGDGGVTLKPDC